MKRTAADIEAAKRRSWEYQWSSGAVAEVRHPDFGSVYVPARSPYAAVLCAAEVWGVDWMRIRGPLCSVTAAPPGARAVERPKEWTKMR